MKTIVQKHLLSIVCALSLLLLLLPLAKISASVDTGYGDYSQQVSVSGLKALEGIVFAYFLVLGPAFLVAMNYIKPVEKYKGIIALVVPVVCLICLILTIIQSKKFANAASYGADNLDLSIKIGIGAILEILTYIGMAVAGLITYHNFSLDKAGLEKLKAQGGNLVDAAKSKLDEKKAAKAAAPARPVQTVAEVPAPQPVQTVAEAPAVQPVAAAPVPVAAAPVKPAPVNMNRADEVLALIERLAKMKESGILTEEEFTEKKQALLKEI